MAKLHAAPGAPKGREIFERGGVWVSYRLVVVDTAERIPPEGVKTPKKSSSGSHLDTKEVEAVAAAL